MLNGRERLVSRGGELRVVPQQNNTLSSVDNVFDIIEHIRVEDRVTVTELASDFGMPKSTVQMYLNTLYANGLVVKRDGAYQLSLQFLKLGVATLWNEPLVPIVRPKVDELAAETGELAACFVEERNEAVYVYGTRGERAISTDMSVGDRSELHWTASGKAMLAHLPEERRRKILDGPLEAKTDHTITDPRDLRAELDRIHERGYACSEQESVEGVTVVAAPILRDGEALGAINVAGPANRFVGDYFERELPELVTGVANEIELNLTYSESGL